jgi:hypothetical protein
MNNLGKLIPVILLLCGMLLWARTCNKVSREHSIEEIVKDQRIATAIIQSKLYNAKKADTDYYYSFYADSVKYTYVTNAAINKNIGDTLTINYSVKTPTSSYYYKENDGSYSFSLIDVVVLLIAVFVIGLIAYARHSKSQKRK